VVVGCSVTLDALASSISSSYQARAESFGRNATATSDSWREVSGVAEPSGIWISASDVVTSRRRTVSAVLRRYAGSWAPSTAGATRATARSGRRGCTGLCRVVVAR
jgi:hypothetical protein